MNNFAKNIFYNITTYFEVSLTLVLLILYASVNTQIKINNVDTTFVNLGEVFSSFAGYYDGKI
ncbi:MAG: hypothetical protein Q9M97_05725, partial [Candidatus Gracilibacteria bacterium]|nr:hypothetical protein [Candidatus Gracilibacteria bacterium]